MAEQAITGQPKVEGDRISEELRILPRDLKAISDSLAGSTHRDFALEELNNYVDSGGDRGISPLGVLVAAVACRKLKKEYGVDEWLSEPKRRELAEKALLFAVSPKGKFEGSREEREEKEEEVLDRFEDGRASLEGVVEKVVSIWVGDPEACPWAAVVRQVEMNQKLGRMVAELETDLKTTQQKLDQAEEAKTAAVAEKVRVLEGEIERLQGEIGRKDRERFEELEEVSQRLEAVPPKARLGLLELASFVAEFPRDEKFLESLAKIALQVEFSRAGTKGQASASVSRLLEESVSIGGRVLDGKERRILVERLAAFTFKAKGLSPEEKTLLFPNLANVLRAGIKENLEEKEKQRQREEEGGELKKYFKDNEPVLQAFPGNRMEIVVGKEVGEKIDRVRALGISGDLFTARGKLRMKDGGELGLWALFRGENSRVGVGMATIFENDSDLNDAIVGLAVAIPRNPLYHDSLVLLKREELGWKVIVKGDEREIGILEVKDGGTIVLESRPDTGIREGLEVTVHLAALLSRFVGRGVSPVRISLEASVIREETAAPGAEEGQKEGAVSVPEEVAPAGKEAAVEGRVTEPTAEAGAPVEVEAAQTPSSPAVPPPAGDQPEVPGGQKRGRSDVAL